jgi:putative SOS response-associated peptidase YedK
MCARITITTTREEIANLFGLGYDTRLPATPRYNVAPSSFIPVIRVASGVRELADLRWGLVPHWTANTPKVVGYPNARVETAIDKPAFRDPLRTRRCLVLVDGFFEWKTLGKKKLPYHFRKGGGGLLAFAGVWDRWNGPSGALETVTILTVPANELVKPLHDRMPANVPEGLFGTWLDPKQTNATKVLPLLVPYPAERMEKWRVSERVNHVAAEGPDLLLPVEEPPAPTWTQPSLFDVA